MTAHNLPSIRPAHDVEISRVYARYFDVLRAHAARHVDEAEAEDVVHAAFERYYARLQEPTAEPVHTPKGMLYRMVIGCAMDARRANRSYLGLLARDTGPTATVRRWMTTHRRQEDTEIGQHLKQALDKLRKSWRAVFVLARIDGLSHAEIAEALQISEEASRAHLWRAPSALRSELTRAGMTPDRVKSRKATK